MARSGHPFAQSSTAVPLFPTLVWRAILREEVYTPLNRAIMATLAQMQPRFGPGPPGRTLQTEQDLHTRPELGELVHYIKASVASVLKATKVVYEAFEITGCWANIAPPGGQHAMHSHPNNYLSGVYYAKVPEGGNAIQFEDPRTQCNVMMPPRSEYNETNSGRVSMPVETGLLVLFPSWLIHSVGVNRGNTERVSVSFDIMFSRFAETMGKPQFTPNIRGASG